jgi:hypothetical protein
VSKCSVQIEADIEADIFEGIPIGKRLAVHEGLKSRFYEVVEAEFRIDGRLLLASKMERRFFPIGGSFEFSIPSISNHFEPPQLDLSTVRLPRHSKLFNRSDPYSPEAHRRLGKPSDYPLLKAKLDRKLVSWS